MQIHLICYILFRSKEKANSEFGYHGKWQSSLYWLIPQLPAQTCLYRFCLSQMTQWEDVETDIEDPAVHILPPFLMG